jgi:hypothetical protein
MQEKFIEFQLHLSNKSDSETLEKGFVVKFEASAYFESKEVSIKEPIGPDESVSKLVKLLIRAGAHHNDFPESLVYKITYGGQASWKASAAFNTGFLRGTFMTGDREKYNVMPFGMKGHGKSSLMNSLATSLSKGNRVLQMFSALQLSDHVTETFSCQSLSDCYDEEGFEKMPFVFYDMWGVDGNVAELRQYFPQFVRGCVPLNTHREKLKSIIYQVPSPEAHIHCLLIVTRLASRLDSNDMEMIATLCKDWISLDLVGPVVVVTGVDNVENPELRAQGINEMRSLLPAKQNVFFVQNYTNQSQRSPRIDIEMRKILVAVRNVSLENIKRIKKKYGIPIDRPTTAGSSSSASSRRDAPANSASTASRPQATIPTPQRNPPASNARDLNTILAALGVPIMDDLDFVVDDFEDSDKNEIQQAFEQVGYDAADAANIANEIYKQFHPEQSAEADDIQWAELLPRLSQNYADILLNSGFSPNDFLGSTMEDIKRFMKDDLRLPTPVSNMIARRLTEHFGQN